MMRLVKQCRDLIQDLFDIRSENQPAFPGLVDIWGVRQLPSLQFQ